jgi:hypothetical protein
MPKVSSSIKAAILLGQGQGTVHIRKKVFACSLIRSHDELVVLRKSSNLSMPEL